MKLTQAQEKAYLLDLLFEAARYRDVPMDSAYSAIELEIRDRIQRLTSAEDDADAPCKSMLQQDPKPEPQVESEAARLNEYLEQRKEQKKQAVGSRPRRKEECVRVFINGKPVWKKREQCIKVPRDNSRGGLNWTWRWINENSATVAENSTTKDEQCEAMWAEHEQSK